MFRQHARRSLCGGLIAVAAVLSGAAGASASTTCTTSGPAICVDAGHTPDTVSAATPGTTSAVQYTLVVRNGGPSTATHVTLADTIPAGTTLLTADTDQGSCAPSVPGATCYLGNIGAGAQVTVRLSVRAPSAPGVIQNAATVSFDERSNDLGAADPKQDTVVSVDPTTVVVATGKVQSWVPAGFSADLSTDPTGAFTATPSESLLGAVHVPARPLGVVASLSRFAAPFTCPSGEICRTGDWMQASVPGEYLADPLRFTVRWDASVVDKKQTARNFKVFYRHCLDTCPLEIIDRTCPSQNPAAADRPCELVRREGDGDFTAVVIRSTNGYMR